MNPKLIALASALALLVSCMDKTTAPSGRAPLDSDVVIGLAERLPERTLVLDCKTVHIYPCMNYGLDASFRQTASTIQARFNGVLVPQVCATALGPATIRFALGPLVQSPVSLELRNNSVPVAGLLTMTPDAYTIAVPPGAVVFPEPILMRIPAGTIWGVFGYASPDEETSVRAILAEMVALGGKPVALPEGRYSVLLKDHQGDTFRADASGAIDYGGNLGYYHTLPFALSFTGDPLALRDLVARTGRDHGDAIHLWIYSASGDAFFSWVLGRGI